MDNRCLWRERSNNEFLLFSDFHSPKQCNNNDFFFLKKIKTKIVTLFNNCKNLMRFYLLFILLL